MADHPPFAVTADLVVLAVREHEAHVLLVRRGGEPFAGAWALPGGFVEVDEDVAAAAARELGEETGLDAGALRLEQLPVAGAPGRDPRGRVVSVPWLALVAEPGAVAGGDDAADARWVPVATALAGPDEPPLAFDHAGVLAGALSRAVRRLEDSEGALALLGPDAPLSRVRALREALTLAASVQDAASVPRPAQQGVAHAAS